MSAQQQRLRARLHTQIKEDILVMSAFLRLLEEATAGQDSDLVQLSIKELKITLEELRNEMRENVKQSLTARSK